MTTNETPITFRIQRMFVLDGDALRQRPDADRFPILPDTVYVLADGRVLTETSEDSGDGGWALYPSLDAAWEGHAAPSELYVGDKSPYSGVFEIDADSHWYAAADIAALT